MTGIELLVQKAARQPTVCLLRGGGTREEGGMERMRESKTERKQNKGKDKG